MAFILLKNGKGRVVSAEQGHEMWRVFNNEAPGTPEQQKFLKLIKKIYLNRANAPESYLAAYPTSQPIAAKARLPYVD